MRWRGRGGLARAILYRLLGRRQGGQGGKEVKLEVGGLIGLGIRRMGGSFFAFCFVFAYIFF